MDEERIRGTYSEENIDPGKQTFRQWERELTKVCLKE
jgi:hypothetical protein